MYEKNNLYLMVQIVFYNAINCIALIFHPNTSLNLNYSRQYKLT